MNMFFLEIVLIILNKCESGDKVQKVIFNDIPI